MDEQYLSIFSGIGSRKLRHNTPVYQCPCHRPSVRPLVEAYQAGQTREEGIRDLFAQLIA